MIVRPLFATVVLLNVLLAIINFEYLRAREAQIHTTTGKARKRDQQAWVLFTTLFPCLSRLSLNAQKNIRITDKRVKDRATHRIKQKAAALSVAT